MTNPINTPGEEKPNRPIWSKSEGRVDASVWRHEQENGVRHTISLSRSYKARSGEWRHDHFFDIQDLASVERLCSDVRQYLEKQAA